MIDGAKLKKIRALQGLSQTEFAARIKASRGQITDWERDRYPVPPWAEENIGREFSSKKATPKLSARQKKIVEAFDKIMKVEDREIFDMLEKHLNLLLDLVSRRKATK